MNPLLVEAENLFHRYRNREALRGLSFSVMRGEIFGLLGPNGSGKTTLFKILATAFPPTSGKAKIDSRDVVREPGPVREKTGIVFQSPSLDAKLTVRENLEHHGFFYGITGPELVCRVRDRLEKFGLADRARDLVEKLSGGLKRRVELAKALLHDPVLLILDEPSTGLDPGARIDFWRTLKTLQREAGMTVLVTTHWMEEAERCDRIAILSEGRIAAVGRPEELKRAIGGDVVEITCADAQNLGKKIEEHLGVRTRLVEGKIHIEHGTGPELTARIAQAFPGEIEELVYRKASLEDVYIHETGHKFWTENGEGA